MTKAICVVLGFCMSLVALASCSSAEQHEKVSYAAERGVLTAVVRASLTRTARATKEAMDDLYLRPYDRHRDGVSALFLGDTAEGNEVRVILQRLSSLTTRVTIRVVDSRDREKLERLLEQIKERV